MVNHFYKLLISTLTVGAGSSHFKVYLIGVVETVYITLYQRGLFKSSSTRALNESHADALTHELNNDGSIAVITGGDSGIGLEICKGLLKAGFHVIIGIYIMSYTCKININIIYFQGTHSVKSGEGVLDALENMTCSKEKISCIQLDLTSYKSVLNFVDKVKEKIPKKNIQLLISKVDKLLMIKKYKYNDFF